jgi:anion-transporting  ArsA/GET3 family ATPase
MSLRLRLGDHRFLFITGKGGVGKTTMAATLATKLARDGKRVLIAMCNAKERLSGMLGCAPIGCEVVNVRAGLWAVNMEPQHALREYGLLALKSRTLTKVLFDNKYAQTFFRAVPGMQEWTLLGKAWWHTTELDDDGRNKYDIVIVDGPATGHGLDMLRVPKVIVELVPPGLLRRDAERAWQMFQDPSRSGVVIVTLPEDLPATETQELAASLKTELGLPLAHLFVNGRLDTLFSEADQGALKAFAERARDGRTLSVRETAELAWVRAQREQAQLMCMTRLNNLGIATTVVPFLALGVSSPTQIEQLVTSIPRV